MSCYVSLHTLFSNTMPLHNNQILIQTFQLQLINYLSSLFFFYFIIFFFNFREQIIDDIEITILSRELPDRLLLFRNIVHDPQVGAAVAVLRESILHSDTFSNTVHDTCVLPGIPDEIIASCINDKLVAGNNVVDRYDTLLSSPLKKNDKLTSAP